MITLLVLANLATFVFRFFRNEFKPYTLGSEIRYAVSGFTIIADGILIICAMYKYLP